MTKTEVYNNNNKTYTSQKLTVLLHSFLLSLVCLQLLCCRV